MLQCRVSCRPLRCSIFIRCERTGPDPQRACAGARHRAMTLTLCLQQSLWGADPLQTRSRSLSVMIRPVTTSRPDKQLRHPREPLSSTLECSSSHMAALAVYTRSAAALLEFERTHDVRRGVLCMTGGASGRDCRKPGLPRVELNLAAAAGLASRCHEIVQI